MFADTRHTSDAPSTHDRILGLHRDGSCSVWALAERPDGHSDRENAAALLKRRLKAGELPMGEARVGYWWELQARHYFDKGFSHVTSAVYHASTRLLVVGFSTGVFSLYEMPEMNEVHTLSISENRRVSDPQSPTLSLRPSVSDPPTPHLRTLLSHPPLQPSSPTLIA